MRCVVEVRYRNSDRVQSYQVEHNCSSNEYFAISEIRKAITEREAIPLKIYPDRGDNILVINTREVAEIKVLPM